jgi:hypothetical protein
MLNNNTSKLKIEGSVDDIMKFAYGGKPRRTLAIPAGQAPKFGFGGQTQSLQEGGMAEGPEHEEGGIAAVQAQTGEQVAEIEGGERVFSQEDTAMLEQGAMQIIEMTDAGDQAGADDMAKKLGYAVVNMIAAQEQNQAQQEQGMAQQGAAPQGGGGQPSPEEMAAMEAEAMNQFGTEPQMQ